MSKLGGHPWPFDIETDVELAITGDPEWMAGAQWRARESGHPERSVAIHIAEVLQNVEAEAPSASVRARLRLITLLHDTFKYRSALQRPDATDLHHGEVARQFGERYISDEGILEVVEFHDEAYVAWRIGHVQHDWAYAADYAGQLVDRLLPTNLDLFIHFFRCDNLTGSKIRDSVRWFEGYVCGAGHPPPDSGLTIDPSLR